MMLLYAAADVAFVAGSFVQVGGHNMIEPAALGKPVVTGPWLFNFAEVSAEMMAAGGMMKVAQPAELASVLLRFAEDADLRAATGQKALAVVAKNRGALQRQLEVIASVM